jgi:UDP-N-acetylglucosamine--N-acetylmuramyl-(pentapeptide) pyrophosphoryl-undecaprenol N-acetylglucosamine transferase
VQQKDLNPQWLADMIKNLELSDLLSTARKAKKMQKLDATEAVVSACESLGAKP